MTTAVPQEHLNIFLKASEIKKQNNAKLKSLNVQSDEAKAIIIAYMKATTQTCIQVSEGNYIVVKENISKPALNAEFVTAAYSAFQKAKSRSVDISEGSEFFTFCEQHRKRLATKTYDIALSQSRPVSMMFSTI